MNTFMIFSEAGDKRAFEIENSYISIGSICRVLKSESDISEITKRKLFQSPSDIHVRFKCNGADFIVWEPYSDSSRYWIGEEAKCTDIKALEKVENLFKKYNPPFHRRLIGDIVTLNFLKVLFRPKK